MTLTELKYVIAVARMRHFGRAAESCFVSQPSLSVAIRKLEEELGVTIFERRTSDISITPIGQQIVEQAQRVLDESRRIIDIAQNGHDPLAAPLRLGVILTIAPYLLPNLLTELSDSCSQMPLYLEESFTDELLEKLRSGQIDAAIMADTIHGTGMMTQTLYQEEFVVAVPSHHPWVNRNFVNADELKDQTMLLLGSGHCFRDQILGICPDLNRRTKSDRSEVQHTVGGRACSRSATWSRKVSASRFCPPRPFPISRALRRASRFFPSSSPLPRAASFSSGARATRAKRRFRRSRRPCARSF